MGRNVCAQYFQSLLETQVLMLEQPCICFLLPSQS